MNEHFAFLNTQLQELEKIADPRKLLAGEGDVGGQIISVAEKQALRSEIQEQEVLMQGYQKV